MICVPSVYSRSFYSYNLAKSKYDEIKRIGLELLEERNKLSLWTQEHLLQCLELSKHEYCKLTCSLVNHISSHFYNALRDDVYTAYKNRFESVRKKMRCHLKEHVRTEYYKRSSKEYKKGDVKNVVYEDKYTDVTKTVSYLTQYGEQNKYPENIQRNVDKFKDAGYYDRLISLVNERRKRILSRYSEPIHFKTPTFRGRSRLSDDIVSYNRDPNSVVEGFVNLSWPKDRLLPDEKVMSIPVKLNNKYYGNLKDYSNKSDTSYIIQISRDKIRIILTKDGEREYPEVSLNPDEIEGIDVNTKHNMFVTSCGYEVKHHYKLLNAIVEHEKETDRLREESKKRGEDYKIGKRRQAKSEKLASKYEDYIEREIVTCCKSLYGLGKRHLVLEDLQGRWRKCYGDSKEHDVNQNRINKAVCLASIKDVCMHIAPHYGFAVSLVNPAYTSQTCPRCGCIDKKNRVTQENFECIECGFKDNADVLSAGNARFRISDAVLREKLSVLNENKTGFIPNKIKYKDVKSVINNFRTIIWKNPDVENSSKPIQ